MPPPDAKEAPTRPAYDIALDIACDVVDDVVDDVVYDIVCDITYDIVYYVVYDIEESCSFILIVSCTDIPGGVGPTTGTAVL